AFTGSISSPLNCVGEAACPLEFDLHSDTLAVSDIASLLGFTEKGWSLPFISGSDNKLPEFHAAGKLAVDELKVAEMPLEKFSAHAEVGDRTLAINHIAAKLGGGTTQGEWKIDWNGSPTHFAGTGTLEGVALDRVGPLDTVPGQVAQWIAGKGQV